MNNRLEDEPRIVTLTIAVKITVGYRSCDVCGRESPAPSSDVLVDAAIDMVHRQAERTLLDKIGGYLWPCSQDSITWTPPGWTKGPRGESLCDGCSAAVAEALAARKATAT
jgi:hypothetical protein